MDSSKVPENSIVCLRYVNIPEWILFTRWTREIKEAYEFAHSKPETIQKHNREPIFHDAMYEHISLDDQTPDKLYSMYEEGSKKLTRTKISEHKLLFILESG